MNINPNDLWGKALEIMEGKVSNTGFETWLKPVKPIRFEDYSIVLQVPNGFSKDWLESRYYSLIKDSLNVITNQNIEPSFVVPTSQSEFNPGKRDVQSPSLRENTGNLKFSSLNHKYTFNNFIVGENNRLAHAAALMALQSPAGSYNPLFVCSGVGLGKTHLLQAIGNSVMENSPGAKVLYITSEKFTEDLINFIRDDRTIRFRQKYRDADILLIDDIHFLAGKERTQEELFHTFNALYEANKKIVIASAKPPKQIPCLEESLCSRFEGGLVVDILPPDLETRMEILRKVAEAENAEIPSDVIAYIAELFSSNIRELTGALNRIILFSSVKQNEITLDLASEALLGVMPSPA